MQILAVCYIILVEAETRTASFACWNIYSILNQLCDCITYPLYLLNNNGNCQRCLRSGWLILIILNESLSVQLRFTVINRLNHNGCVWCGNIRPSDWPNGANHCDSAAWRALRNVSFFPPTFAVAIRSAYEGSSVSLAESLQWYCRYIQRWQWEGSVRGCLFLSQDSTVMPDCCWKFKWIPLMCGILQW